MTVTMEQAAGPRARLRAEVSLAARVLPVLYPIETFIAVNPLGGFEDRPFEQAVERAGEVFGARGTLREEDYRAFHAAGRITDADVLGVLGDRAQGPAVAIGGVAHTPGAVLLADLLHGAPAPAPVRRLMTPAERRSPAVADAVDAQTSKWCAAFLDEGQAGWGMPGRERGFYQAWRALAPHDRSLPAAVRAGLRDLPERAEDAVLTAFDALGIPAVEWRACAEAHLTRLPGWAAHVRWRADHGAPGIDLVDYLALRLSCEALLLEGAPPAGRTAPALPEPGPSPVVRAIRVADALGADMADAEMGAVAALLDAFPVEGRTAVWQKAFEAHYRDGLLAALAQDAPAPSTGRPDAQLVCCIDARSEGLRRHFEHLGRYETLGFAGFFAVAIRYQDMLGGDASALCPVLLEPRNEIYERAMPGAEDRAARAIDGRLTLAGGDEAFHAAKDDLVAPFALAEAAGWVAGPLAAARTLVAGSYGQARARLHRRAVPHAPTTVTATDGFTFEERALFAKVALTMMGLVSGFGRLVVLCGHGSSTENNPYEAALDCGACGGNRGAPNARVAAAILNGTDVRESLAAEGIHIPEDTWFVAGEHDTATDRVELLDEHLVPPGHRDELARLAADLERAGDALSAERCALLPGAPEGPSPAFGARHTRSRSTDWAQVYPEWGLAGNAAFIVGPRSMTAHLDLGRRTFLHSYEADADPEGAGLETILTAPLVVAQWISCQYYFSTVEPEVFGSGSKTIHNVVGGIGVLSGHNGDLQMGLPWQSVADGDRLVHEPMRLMAVVQAPLARIDEIVARNTILQHLFGNEWVALAAREQAGDPWLRHTTHGWTPWTTPEEARR